MLVDEIGYALSTSLTKVLIELFQSHVSNPCGAQLVFTTHRAEVLGYLPRRDDVYLLVRGGDHVDEVVKYAGCIRDDSCEKNEVLLANAIKGSTPSYPAVEGLRAYVRGM